MRGVSRFRDQEKGKKLRLRKGVPAAIVRAAGEGTKADIGTIDLQEICRLTRWMSDGGFFRGGRGFNAKAFFTGG